jgi:Phage integrase family.|nr:MAG TPA: Integrase [Caudoviricetes sp.]
MKKRILPARLREKKLPSGNVYYYYDTCQKPRKWIPLGADFYEALKQYEVLEQEYNVAELSTQINEVLTFAYVAKRYMREVMPKKRISTQKGNMRELEKLLEFFNNPPAPINAIRPVHIREYFNWRNQTAKIRANREIALFSHIFNKAREWGYTDNENPVRGVAKNTEKGRDVYVSDEIFWRVFDCADKHIQQLMLVAYLCSQRVTDTRTLRVSHFYDGALWIEQGKSKQKLRIALTGTFANIIEQILQERGKLHHDFLFTKNGQPISHNQLRYGMDKARRLAGVPKSDFQFRDLRAKAGTDKDEEQGLNAARDLLGHKNSSMTVHYVRHRKGKLVQPTKENFAPK